MNTFSISFSETGMLALGRRTVVSLTSGTHLILAHVTPHLAPPAQNVLARYASVASALILGLSGGLFSAAVRPGQHPFSYWARTWHSKIEIRDQNRK